MSPDGPIIYIVIFSLLICSAFFSMSETALACCNKIRMKVKADDGSKAAKLVCKLVDKDNKTLITILIGNNLVNVLMSTLATILFAYLFYHIQNDFILMIVSTLITTGVVYVFGEAMPKSIAFANADGIALFSSYIVYGLSIVLTPISIIFLGIDWVVKKIFKTKEEPTLTEDDFTNVIEAIEEEGILEENESDIIQSAFDYGDTTAKEVLTKRENIFALDIKNLTQNSVLDLLNECKFARIPIYDKSIDNIIGILHVRTFLKEYIANNKVSVRAILKKPYFVSNNASLEEIFEGFKKNKIHMAIVQGQNKKTIGLLTMDDVLEELVGEFAESHPEKEKKFASSKKGGAS